jgi:hypothetical protein
MFKYYRNLGIAEYNGKYYNVRVVFNGKWNHLYAEVDDIFPTIRFVWFGWEAE